AFCIHRLFLLPFPFSFHSPPTPAIYPLSLHDALPISRRSQRAIEHRQILGLQVWCAFDFSVLVDVGNDLAGLLRRVAQRDRFLRSEEHTSELQSLAYLVCRLLLEKKKKHNSHTLSIDL